MLLYDVLYPRILRAVQGVQLKRYSMAPGVDFANHADNAHMTVAYEYFTDMFVARAVKDVAEGDQVTLSYGAQSNDLLLLHYGFVLENNSSDDYVFGEAADQALKVAPGTLRVNRSGHFAQHTVKQVARAFEGSRDNISVVLRTLCQAELDGFATTIEEDELILKKDLSSEMRTAVLYRMGKKKILHRASQQI